MTKGQRNGVKIEYITDAPGQFYGGIGTQPGTSVGTVTPQVYLGLPRSTGEPPKRLVGFARLSLSPGQTRRVQITIDPASPSRPLSYFNTAANTWQTASGRYIAYVGDNERQTPLARRFVITPR